MGKRFMRLILERFLQHIIPNQAPEIVKDKEKKLRLAIFEELFEMKEGLPLYLSAKLIQKNWMFNSSIIFTLIPEKLLIEIAKQWHAIWLIINSDQLDKKKPLKGSEILQNLGNLINPALLTMTLFQLIHLEYGTVEAVYNKLFSRVDIWNTLKEDAILKRLNSLLFQNLPDFNISQTKAHKAGNFICPFVSICGPSACFCFCGYSFIPEKYVGRRNIDSKEFSAAVYACRNAHFVQEYGSAVPSNKSTHYNQCKIVSSVMMHAYPLNGDSLLPQEVTRQMVLDCLKSVYKNCYDAKHGNIFLEHKITNLVKILYSYLPFWHQAKQTVNEEKKSSIEKPNRRSGSGFIDFKSKLLMELGCEADSKTISTIKSHIQEKQQEFMKQCQLINTRSAEIIPNYNQLITSLNEKEILYVLPNSR